MKNVFATISLIFAIFFTGCSFTNPFVNPHKTTHYGSSDINYDAPMAEDDIDEIHASDRIYKSTMKPYKVRGKWYYPIPAHEGDTYDGKASWYGPNFHGHLTSNGERYNMHKRTAAHKTLPINTYVRVINLDNGLETVVRINDRGPFVSGRIIDLSYQAAKEIGLIKHGVVPVRLEVVSCDESANCYAYKKPKKKTYKKVVQNKNNRYFVQIASIYNKSQAIKLKKRYSSIDKNYQPYLVAREYKNKMIYKLLIGRFATSEDAKNFIKAKNFKNAFVVKD